MSLVLNTIQTAHQAGFMPAAPGGGTAPGGGSCGSAGSPARGAAGVPLDGVTGAGVTRACAPDRAGGAPHGGVFVGRSSSTGAGRGAGAGAGGPGGGGSAGTGRGRRVRRPVASAFHWSRT